MTAPTLAVRHGWIDRLPPTLRTPVIVHVHGDMVARGAAILALREALLAGSIPAFDALPWPEPELRRPLLDALVEANVARYAAGDPDVTDDICAYVLDTIEEAHQLHDRALVAFHTLAKKDRYPPGGA